MNSSAGPPGSISRAPISGGINADEGYWDALAQGEFRLPRCASCHRWRWPANWRCAPCGGWDQEWVETEPVGTVYSWTRSWMTFDRIAGRAADVPFVVILAEIPAADGARVLGVLLGTEEGLAIGAPVRGLITPPSEKSLGYVSLCWTLAGN